MLHELYDSPDVPFYLLDHIESDDELDALDLALMEDSNQDGWDDLMLSDDFDEEEFDDEEEEDEDELVYDDEF